MSSLTNSDVPALIVQAVSSDTPVHKRVNNITVSTRYNGDVEVLSYATRMALIVKGERPYAVLNTNKYSRTTSRHMNHIRQGISQAGIEDVAGRAGEPPVR